jgi:hypothetical protein
VASGNGEQEANLLDLVLESVPPTMNACPACRAAMATGAVVCLSCGYNAQTRAAVDVQVHRAPREPLLGGWLGPLVAGTVMLAAVVVGALLARGRGAEGLGMFALPAIAVCAIWYVWLLVDARSVEGAQSKIYLIPFYFLYYVYNESENRYLRAITPGVLAGIIAFLLLGYAHSRQPPKQPQSMWVDRPQQQPAASP